MEEQKRRTNEFAIVSLVLGILSFFTILGLEKVVLAIVFGILGLGRIKRDAMLKGKALAWAGIILGIIALILTVIMAIIYLPKVLQSYGPVQNVTIPLTGK